MKTKLLSFSVDTHRIEPNKAGEEVTFQSTVSGAVTIGGFEKSKILKVWDYLLSHIPLLSQDPSKIKEFFLLQTDGVPGHFTVIFKVVDKPISPGDRNIYIMA